MSTLKLFTFSAVFAVGLVIVTLSLLMNRNASLKMPLSSSTVSVLTSYITPLSSTTEDTFDLSECQEDLSWVGDGFCDDATNVPSCNYDGGDCCLDEVLEYNCGLCLCNDIGIKILTESPSTAITSLKVCTDEDNAIIGDGICDQDLNHESCRYDGGDCCDELTSVFCDTCPCHLIEKTCPHNQSLIGDYVCHDETNNQLCNYDGLDCCESVSNFDHCTWCECIPPWLGCAECVTGKEALKGDGFCDDENNIKECQYDGGDCCGPNVHNYFCFDCKCLEPGYGGNAPNEPSYPMFGK